MKRIYSLSKVHARARQHGLTLVELMVAMVLALLISMAAAGALFIARQGFTNVDAAAQLRDNGRFAQDLLQRIGTQAGFKSLQFAATSQPTSTDGISDTPAPNVFGLNNASRTISNTWDAGTTRASGSVGYGSDILVLRYQVSTSAVSSTTSDGTMIDCMGISPTAIPTDRQDRIVSILHIGVANGEPSLMCSRSDTGAANYDSQPLVQGVENFQVLYGVDGIAPGNSTVPIPASTADSVPERYLRADQLTVTGNTAATTANWQRVRSIRIGMVLRARAGSAIDKTTQTFYPLGEAKSSSSGTAGSAFEASNDPGTTFTPAVDGRLRQVVTFTIHLRNYQEDL
ncbi:PilW family protein [Comamonas sp. Y33R10-2]|uniref:PilW family protein n=1 Tax=Comamonas sp. Y33R10-2 TaxID=2853257 RepID=UPI001C5CB3A5|nr:PilW family protein [Comamonas sp. Y33R10-2]QXZ10155.1 PilW family protein [Comamonas sp. Y33R10-2]